MTSGIGLCACGCGEEITNEGSSYAGADETTRNRHRARAAYKRKNQGADVQLPGTREALAKLGLADDVPISDLAKHVAAAMTELARRTVGIDSTAIQQEISRGLEEARGKVQSAEAAAEQSRVKQSEMAEQLVQAVERADQADEDAASAAGRAEVLEGQVAKLSETVAKTDRDLAASRTAQDEAEREAQQAKALVETLKGEHARLIEEVRRTAVADTAVKLAEQRQEHMEKLAGVTAELVAERAGLTAAKAEVERLNSTLADVLDRSERHEVEIRDLRAETSSLKHQVSTAERERHQAVEARERTEAEISTLRTALEQERQRADRATWELERLTKESTSTSTPKGRTAK